MASMALGSPSNGNESDRQVNSDANQRAGERRPTSAAS
jgi:hypothetical protein